MRPFGLLYITVRSVDSLLGHFISKIKYSSALENILGEAANTLTWRPINVTCETATPPALSIVSNQEIVIKTR